MKLLRFNIKPSRPTTLRSRATLGIVALLAMIPMNGCDTNIAVINFHQVGVCTSYLDPNVPDPTVHAQEPPNFYVLFSVDSIDTTGSKIGFTFDPSKLTVRGGASGEPSVDMLLARSLKGPFAAVAGPQQIPPGQKIPHDSFASGFYVAALITAPANSSSPPLFSLNYPAFQKGAPIVNVVDPSSHPSAGQQTDNCANIL